MFTKIQTTYLLKHFLQLTINAKDKGNPELTSGNAATVTITVSRNQNAPVFTDGPTQVINPINNQINENQQLNTKFYTFRVTDADTVVSLYYELLFFTFLFRC